ncbi:hypothetical protein BHM03_00005706, partial [Ensete ventricosum]
MPNSSLHQCPQCREHPAERRHRQVHTDLPHPPPLLPDCFVEAKPDVLSGALQSRRPRGITRLRRTTLTTSFDKVIKAKAAVDAVAQCRNKVSGADILAIAARDVIPLVGSFVTLDLRAISFTVFCLSNSWACYNQAGGPSYSVGLGRVDELRSTAASVTGFNLNQLTSLFVAKGLSQSDMIALS